MLKIALKPSTRSFRISISPSARKGCDELPPKVAALVAEIETITKTMAQEEETLKAKKGRVADLHGRQRTLQRCGAILPRYHTPRHPLPSDSTQRPFEKDHADLFAAYRTKITKKSGLSDRENQQKRRKITTLKTEIMKKEQKIIELREAEAQGRRLETKIAFALRSGEEKRASLMKLRADELKDTKTETAF